MSLIKNNRVIIVTFAKGIDKHPELFEKTGYGIEISDFAFTRNLDSPDFNKLLNRVKENVKCVSGTITMHAPYRNMDPASTDNNIVEVCFERYGKSIEIAKEIGAEQLVFHANYNPLYSTVKYDEFFIEKNILFFERLFKEYGEEIKINLENMFEPSFEVLFPLFEYFEGKIGLLLDSGHLNVYSKVSPSEWLKKGNKFLNYLHLNDNNGKMDKHNSIGSGTFNFYNFFKNVDFKEELNVAVEVKNFEEVKKSLLFLKDNKIIGDY